MLASELLLGHSPTLRGDKRRIPGKSDGVTSLMLAVANPLLAKNVRCGHCKEA